MDSTENHVQTLNGTRQIVMPKPFNCSDFAAALQALIRPHIDSFNFMLLSGLDEAVRNLRPVEFSLPEGQRVELAIKNARIEKPQIPPATNYCATQEVYPAECRERGCTYRGRLSVQLQWTVNDDVTLEEMKPIAEVPIMVKSAMCNLNGLSPAELISRGEEAEEFGGYFIVNGLEKIFRMLILPRRNYPTCQRRSAWKNRGPLYSEHGVSIRCVREDQSAASMILHYLNNGTANLGILYRKEQFFIPVILVLKALRNVTDQVVYNELIKGMEDNSFYKGCIAHMLRQAQEENLSKRSAILKYIGSKFRPKLFLPEWYTDQQIAEFLFSECIGVHLKKNRDKFNLLVLMVQKLFTHAKGGCCTENADSPMFQEVLLGGHLYLMVLKELLEGYLLSMKSFIDVQAKKFGVGYQLTPVNIVQVMKKTINVGRKLEHLLATGNLDSRTGLGLQQISGYAVQTDKLNFYRYLSHFRAVHRGAFFAEMRTTTVRKLLPEAWGFLCPVHTPDGSPCGLLNHLAANCMIVNMPSSTKHLPKLLIEFGMVEYDAQPTRTASECYPVLLDGRMIGWLHEDDAQQAVDKLRTMKVLGRNNVPSTLEICLVKRTRVASQFPLLALFSGVARMMRPVRNLACGADELIGTFEQVYMNICVVPSEGVQGLTTHQEKSEGEMLSAIASLTPYSDFNQSPRNMYQCQMGKQTMGTPLHALRHRSDNKLYKLQTPQSPVVRPVKHDIYGIDDYPLGTNAIVAVISYTGYDMEDAMIINKGSYDRGFAHGSIYKSEFIDLRDDKKVGGRREQCMFIFAKAQEDLDNPKMAHIDDDGLPFVGSYIEEGMPFYSYVNVNTGAVRVVKYRGQEAAWVEQVKACGGDTGQYPLQKVCIIIRIERNPIIGDKFASRAGQKGICSQRWPVENMPFSESGMCPDIIFNPHGFPSRMTIGMMIETMAGKSAAMHGLCHDATPFTFSEETPAIDHFGELLSKAGYNYYGTERMYSGVDGREFEADIFMGVVYYQRLRHMVSDKFQVRTTGPVDPVMRQPVKGRKRGGGVRFGEMERDALLAHGTSFLLEDRLLNCSDKCLVHVCVTCGSLLSPVPEREFSSKLVNIYYKEAQKPWTCLLCGKSENVQVINLPYVFTYLIVELAAMNIKVTLDVKEATERR